MDRTLAYERSMRIRNKALAILDDEWHAGIIKELPTTQDIQDAVESAITITFSDVTAANLRAGGIDDIVIRNLEASLTHTIS